MFQSTIWSFGAILVVWVCWSSLLIGVDSQLTDPKEVTALQAIKKSLIDPYENLWNWNRGDPCVSNWTGVTCFNTTMGDGYMHVALLQLLNLNLSGTLSPEVGHLSYLRILDFMWNKISGRIPNEIGNITSLTLLLLNGNNLTGSLPEEIGFLPNLNRIQIDQNHISGQIPRSFANLKKAQHFHMNNNSISGQIPPELSMLSSLVHLLLDNNNLSGHLPSELANMPHLEILQLDNNHFDGSEIPASYSNMSRLLKLSLRNCSLQGPIPDLSMIPNLAYIDLSSNRLNGSIPPNKLSKNMTTVDLSDNSFTGIIPVNLSDLPRLQRLSLANNSLSGSVPSTIWLNRILNETERLIVDLQNNMISNISGSHYLPSNVTVWLQGNPTCLDANLLQFCGPQRGYVNNISSSINSTNPTGCFIQSCPPPFEYAIESSVPCFCAAPLIVGYRLKSPGFSDFLPYVHAFEAYLTSGLLVNGSQLELDSPMWEHGPRLKMHLKIFPEYVGNNIHAFNKSEVKRIMNMFSGWRLPESDVFGPYELLYFNLLDPYKDVIPHLPKSGISKGKLAGIILGAIAGAATLSAIMSFFIFRMLIRKYHGSTRKRLYSRISVKVDGLRDFTYGEMASATKNFNSSAEVGQGGYGKVYKGVLADGTLVAVKRALEGSLQGEKEFLTEIQLLSRVHHRNLVSLIGYCDDEGEQMLVYEFVHNGTLREHISGKFKDLLSFAMRLRIALGSAKGILYLHTEADPPIFHRDIKASNILLDFKFTAKVADFGLSRLAPVPDIEGTVPDHVSTVVRGTPGYLDPEYFQTHQLTDKSDVYSLGVVFLELLTGMHPISHGKNIVREANMAYQSGTIFSIIDGRMGSYPSECVERFVDLALRCCKDETESRPSMAEVVRELENIWQVMPNADTMTATESSVSSSGRRVVSTTPSSSSTTALRNHYISADISGSDLVSGVAPTIVPR